MGVEFGQVLNSANCCTSENYGIQRSLFLVCGFSWFGARHANCWPFRFSDFTIASVSLPRSIGLVRHKWHVWHPEVSSAFEREEIARRAAGPGPSGLSLSLTMLGSRVIENGVPGSATANPRWIALTSAQRTATSSVLATRAEFVQSLA
jgi:hypothetical protein